MYTCTDSIRFTATATHCNCNTLQLQHTATATQCITRFNQVRLFGQLPIAVCRTISTELLILRSVCDCRVCECTQSNVRSFSHCTLVCECTANPTWGDIFKCCFKAQSSKLERLFSLKRGKRDVRELSFELLKMSPQVGLAVLKVV